MEQFLTYTNATPQPTLNDFAALGRPASRFVRAAIQRAFASHSSYTPPPGAVISIAQAELHMPVHVGDFTDFSCSRDHVLNAGEAVFGKRILPPGFLHFPLGYGGRSSSIVTSGTPVRRPLGQYRSKTDLGVVEFGPSRELDYELELGCIIGKPVQMGDIPTAADADDHIFGVVLLDDWSGKCVKFWESVRRH
jgi:fumarylacetoacetase